MAEESGQAEARRAGKAKKLAPTITVALVSLLVVGIAAYAAVYLAKNIGKIPPEARAEEVKNARNAAAVYFHQLESFQVNLAKPNESKILRAEFTLEFAVADSVLLEPLKSKLRDLDSKIRDIVIGILCTKRVNDISDIVGKEQMKQEIKDTLDKKVIWSEGIALRTVLIRQFVIQF